MNHDCQKAQPLLASYAAGELTQGDRQRVGLIVEDCPDCAAALEALQSGEAKPPTATAPATDAGASVGQVLFIVGLVLVYGTSVYLGISRVVGDPDTHLLIRIGLPLLFLGLAILGTIVLVQRLRATKTDRYKDVEI